MIRKFTAILMVLILALSLTACGGNNSGNGSNSGNTNPPATSAPPANDGNSASQTTTSPDTGTTQPASNNGSNSGAALTASITPASGWEKQEGTTPMYTNADGAIFQLTIDTIPSDIATPEDYVVFAQGKIKEINMFKDAEFSATENTKAGGMDAVEYSFTLSNFGMTYRVIYVCKDGKAYTLSCSAMNEYFNAAKDDFQTMINSLTLK